MNLFFKILSKIVMQSIKYWVSLLNYKYMWTVLLIFYILLYRYQAILKVVYNNYYTLIFC